MENGEHLPSEQDGSKKIGLVQRSKELLDSAVSTLKGQDMNALVEEYTQEVTLVLEGLSSDLNALTEKEEQLAANQTLMEESARTKARETAETLQTLQKRVEALEKKIVAKREKASVSSVLKQVTWIAVILASAWVITAVLRIFGG